MTTQAALQTRQTDLLAIAVAVVRVHDNPALAEQIASALLDGADGRVDEFIDRIAAFTRGLVALRREDGWNLAH